MGTTLSIDNCIGNHKSKQSTASWHTTSAHTGDDSIYDLNEMQNKLDVGEHHVGTLIVAIKSSRSCGSSNNDSIHHLTISSRIQDTRFNSEGVNHICVRFGNETNHDTLPCFNHVEEIEIGFWGRTGAIEIIIVIASPDLNSKPETKEGKMNQDTLHKTHDRARVSKGETKKNGSISYSFKILEFAQHLNHDNFSSKLKPWEAKQELNMLHDVCTAMGNSLVGLNLKFRTPFSVGYPVDTPPSSPVRSSQKNPLRK